MRVAFGLMMVGLLIGCGGPSSSVSAGTMPQGGGFSGVYFSPQYGEMHLVQNGNAVVGKYKKDERAGRIQGEVDGDLLRFEWTEYKAMVSNRPQESRGHGYFRYMIDATNGDHVIKGRWGIDDDDANGGEWNAYKSRSREPDPDSLGVEGEPSSGGESEGGDDEGAGDSSGGDTGGAESGGGEEEEGDDIF